MKKPQVAMAAIENIEITLIEVEPTVEETDVEIDKLAAERLGRSYAPKEGACAGSDQLVCDIAATVDGQPAPELTMEGIAFVQGAGSFIPGFAEKMGGVAAGETREIRITYPRDYQIDSITGKEVVYQVTVRAVRQPCKIDVTDELAEKLGFACAEDIRDQTRTLLKNRYAEPLRQRARRELLDKLAGACGVKAPRSRVDAAFRLAWRREREFLEMAGFEEGMSEREARAACRKAVQQQVVLDIALPVIGEAENVTVDDSEIHEAALRRSRELAAGPVDQMEIHQELRKDPEAMAQLREHAFREKTIDRLMERVKCRRRKVRCKDITSDET